MIKLGAWKLNISDKEIRVIESDGKKCNFRILVFRESNGIDILDPKDYVQVDESSLSICGSDVGVMFPLLGTQNYFGEIVQPLDLRYSMSAKYLCETEDPTALPIANGVVTQSFSKGCVSLQSANPAMFHSFFHVFTPYGNIVSEKLEVQIFSHRSRSEILSKHSLFGNESILSPLRMKQIIFSGSQSKDAHMPLEQARQAQKNAESFGVASCVIGSLALALHGIATDVKDVDLAVASEADLKQISDNMEHSKSKDSKWSNYAIRTDNADFSVVDLDIINSSKTIEGLRVLDLETLLLMKMLGIVETECMNPGYSAFKQKNINSILSILKQYSPRGIYPFFRQFINNVDKNRFNRIHRRINASRPSNMCVNINHPLEANSFKDGDQNIVSVVNLGDPTSACIEVPHKFRNIRWYDVDRSSDVQVESTSGYSRIIVSEVKHGGMLICE